MADVASPDITLDLHDHRVYLAGSGDDPEARSLPGHQQASESLPRTRLRSRKLTVHSFTSFESAERM